MLDAEIVSFDVRGHAGNSLPNRFIRQRAGMHALAVILPGLMYSCDGPLLHYASEALANHGADVAQLWANYDVSEFRSLSKEDQLNWLLSDANALIQAASGQRDYDRFILAGKSIGTLTMSALLKQNDMLLKVNSIWFTPLLKFSFVAEQILRLRTPALFVVGTADHTYDAEAMKRIQEQINPEVLIIENADHSLEIPGDLSRSTDILSRVTKAVAEFTDRILT